VQQKLQDLQDAGGDINKLKTIYSEKQLKFAYDSLLGVLDWNIINQYVQHPETVSNKDLFNALLVRFPAMKNVTKARQDAMLLSTLANNGDPVRAFSSLTALHLDDLKSKKIPDDLLAGLPDSVLSKLPALSGGQLKSKYLQLKSKYLSGLDSMRNLNMRKDGLKLAEEKLDKNSKIARIKKRFGLLNKTYFEGVLGFLNGSINGKMTLLQASPALGFKLTNHFSLGAGPNFLLQEEKRKISAILGMRTFAKMEFLHQRAYSQVEDMINFPRVDKGSVEQRKVNVQHTILAGGGYLIPITKKTILNISILYRMTQIENAQTVGGETSPWIFRVGFSSTMGKK
jgi:hypothetical protein